MAHQPHHNTRKQLEVALRKKVVLVTHHNPDTDAWLGLWLLRSQYLKHKAEILIEFVRAGERLPRDVFASYKDDGYWVEYVDTGRGKNDQHGRELKDTSSFDLLAKNLGKHRDPALAVFLELARKADNVKPIDPMSIHFAFRAMPAYVKTDGEVDWNVVKDYVFMTLDALYSLERMKAHNAKEFRAHAVETLPNGITFAHVPAPQRNAAYQNGVDVVLWTNTTSDGVLNVGVQTNREATVTLESVAEALRKAECEHRGVEPPATKLCSIEKVPGVPSSWYFHDSRKVIVCGSKAHPITRAEQTAIPKERIPHIVREALAQVKLAA
jgi:hypothetical protein